jgi:hypothetical protein
MEDKKTKNARGYIDPSRLFSPLNAGALEEDDAPKKQLGKE